MGNPFMCGMVVGGCMIAAVEYERYFRPKYGDPKLRGCLLVIALWNLSVLVWVITKLGGVILEYLGI